MVVFPVSWEQFLIIVGEVTIIVIMGLILLAFFLVAVALYSIKTGKFVFPRLLSSGFIMLEGLIKVICGLFGLDDRELVTFFIKVHNLMNTRSFEEIPVSKRALFLPQCLRSSHCPAALTPEGLKCKNCGQCTVGESLEQLEKIGYRVFIVPGSSFIQRMVKKYRPAGIIGVGCIIEVKEGLEMCDRVGVCGMGVVTLKDGCVETLVNWQDVFEVACLGMDNTSIRKDLDVSPH
ncbi:MAG: DUF116 domain-containing protein [Methanomicrobiales archaeon]|nr:DUF116 domain-containing protein [Methanomicrobiales archaeon]